MSNARKSTIPSYRHHKPSGQAVVTLNGRDHYLGPWDTSASRAEYDRLISEWAAHGRRLPRTDPSGPPISGLILAYFRFAEGYYRKGGRPTSELVSIREALGSLRRLYGRTQAGEFGPLALKSCREAMIRDGLSRGVINSRVGRIKRMFKWATAEELVEPSVYHGLQAVVGLKRGRSAARETEPVKPVPVEHVDAVLPLVSVQVAAMIRLQLLTGMRPGEVRLMRGSELDMADRDCWTYTPASHKTEHHGIERPIYLGPQAQAVIEPFLKTDLEAYLFSPQDAEQARSEERRANRQTKMTPSQAKRRGRKRPKRTPSDHYTKESYYRAITRACVTADVPPWHPNQLRHNAATRLRKEYGLEVAQVVLGHRTADVTQVYAERDHSKAREVMARIG